MAAARLRYGEEPRISSVYSRSRIRAAGVEGSLARSSIAAHPFVLGAIFMSSAVNFHHKEQTLVFPSKIILLGPHLLVPPICSCAGLSCRASIRGSKASDRI